MSLTVDSWISLEIRHIKRSDLRTSYRKKIHEKFIGYFFLKALFIFHDLRNIKIYSAFIELVRFAEKLEPVSSSLIMKLRDMYPDNHEGTLIAMEAVHTPPISEAQ